MVSRLIGVLDSIILRRLGMKAFDNISKEYAAKIDISLSNGIIRVTGDHTTCSEISRLLYFTVENIQQQDIGILSDIEHKAPVVDAATVIARNALKEKSFINQI